MEHPSYYSIITADVRYDKRLKPNEKLLFSEITALSNKRGYCNASNNYFAQLYDVNTVTASNWVNHLKDRGYIDVEMIYDGKQIKERRIFVNSNPIKKILRGVLKKRLRGVLKKRLRGVLKKRLKRIIQVLIIQVRIISQKKILKSCGSCIHVKKAKRKHLRHIREQSKMEQLTKRSKQVS